MPETDSDSARMTTEQLKELAEALSVLSSRSSVMQERRELRELMSENLAADEVHPHLPPFCKPRFMLIIIFSHPLGPQITLRRTDETDPIHAHDHRQTTWRLRFPCWGLAADDLC